MAKTYLNSRHTIEVLHKSTTESTNNDGKELFRKGIKNPLLIISDEQKGGRGRQGRSFYSPVGGLYMTLVLPCNLPFSSSISVTSCSGIAVTRVLRAHNVNCGIKWVNDIYSNNRKLSGILVEAENDYSENRTIGLIIGIGINALSKPEGKFEVEPVSLSELGFKPDIISLAYEITSEILDMHKNDFDLSLYINEYREYSVLIGKEVTYTLDNIEHTAVVQSINDNGALVVTEGENVSILTSGLISVRF